MSNISWKAKHFSACIATILLVLSIFSVRYAYATEGSMENQLKQRISIVANKKALADVLRDIERKSQLHFAFSTSLVGASEVSIHAESETVENILQRLLSPLKLSYSLLDNVIMIRKESMQAKQSSPQQQQLKGKVLDDQGKPVGGVSVLVKGQQQATVTDAEGQFAIAAAPQTVLQFTAVGYQSQEYTVSSQREIVITLATDNKSLDEVVVTALGINRQKRSLTYSVSEVKGDEFTQARENNVANALTGKIAGVNATGISTGPGGSSRVIIRGNGSLTGANQPLYVVNGMPIDNSTPGGSASTNTGGGNVDRGDGIGGINPDDIETISVLKGGSAAALYGSRAANGVILITTKKGAAQKGIGVDYNGTFSTDDVAVFPDFQYEYGQGDGGVKPADQATAIQTGRRSWGAKIDGSTFIGADGKEHAYVAQPDNIRNFYRTGTNLTNTVAFSGGSESIQYRLSVADLNSRSILPNSTFKRKSANLSLHATLSERLSIEGVAQYNLENAKNRASAGDAYGNPNWTPYMIANTADVRWFDPGYDEHGNELAWNDADVATNSYFVVNKYQQRDEKNRFIGQLGITYKLLKNLSVKGTVSHDFYNFDYTYITPTGTRFVPKGDYTGIATNVAETNGMLTLNYDGRFGEDFTLTALAGGNQRRYSYREQNTQGIQFIIPYFYSATNLTTSATIPLNQRTAINSVFGSADLGYKGFAYLSFTGRQDWFSTLSPQNNSIFYPSVGGSLLLTEAFQLPEVINNFKLRGSWAQVGGATPDPYAIYLAYQMVPSSGYPLQGVSGSTITNENLRPLTSTTSEVGFDLQLFQRRFGVDFTLYDRTTTDDIVTTAITPASGYNSAILNVGELKNRGIELLLTGTPVRSSNFNWDVSYNFSYNKNTVVKLAEGLNTIQMATTVGGWGYINNIVGMPYGQIVGTRMQRDEAGEVVFNPATGLPIATPLEVLGNGVPPFTMGLTNDFRYKNFSLNILLDGKFGNKVFSIMEVYAMRMGLLKSTLEGRENGLELQGVTRDGEAYNRTVPVSDLRNYYDNNKSYSELFLHDGSFIKLRQVVLNYNIPAARLAFLGIQGASVSLVGRNLAILYKKTDNFDPEQSFTNSSSQGFESFGLPRTRNFGVNVKVKF